MENYLNTEKNNMICILTIFHYEIVHRNIISFTLIIIIYLIIIIIFFILIEFKNIE